MLSSNVIIEIKQICMKSSPQSFVRGNGIDDNLWDVSVTSLLKDDNKFPCNNRH